MNPPLPPEIRVESSRQGPRYLLPPRETGPLKFGAIFVIGFGCLFGGFALVWIIAALGITQKDGFQPVGAMFAIFGLPFLAVGLGVIGLGVFALCGRTEIEVTTSELIARERGGLFWWTRRILIKDIRRFTLGSDAVRINDQPVKTGPLSDVGMLAADVGTAKPKMVLMGYPRAWAEALAARLTADLAAQTGAAPLATVTNAEAAAYYRPRVKLLPGEVAGPGTRVVVYGDRFDPPAGTTLRIMEQAGGIVAVVPPQGARSTRGLLAFAVIWLVFISIIGGVIAFASENQKLRKSDSKVIPVVVVGSIGLIGIVMLAVAVNQMRRKASLRASRAELIIVQQSLFGTKTFKRGIGELVTIGVGSSGLLINDVPVQELQVHGTDGETHGFFSNLTKDELLWLATHLRQATGAGEAPGESAEPPKLAS